MKTKVIILALALGASTCLLTAQDSNQAPDGQRPPGREGGPGGPGGRGGPGGFHLLPPRAQEQLNLTDDQKKQVAALEAEVKAKLEKILTPEQLQQLKQMRPPGRMGGPGGGGPGGQGGPDGQGGPGGGENQSKPQHPPSE
jgi:Spy/CpxP family protein refolding chaperone